MSSSYKHRVPFEIVDWSILVIAAGGSTRLGEAKQLLPYKGKPLIQHVLEQALFAKSQAVFTVLGARAEKIRRSIQHLPVNIVHNEKWQEGMGTSIAKGVRVLLRRYPHTKGIALLICDQPFVSDKLIQKIIKQRKETGFELIASRYGENIGVPAYFGQQYFESLLNLDGDQGAKKIILKNIEQAGFVSFPEGAFDVDTQQDYQQLLHWEKENHHTIQRKFL